MTLDPRYRWYRITLKNENLQDEDFYFRGITAGERRSAGTKATKFEAEQFLLSRLVLPEKNWDTMLAGSCAVLLREIIKYSGLDENGLTFEEAIAWIQSEDGALEAAAVAMIPSCTPDVLENCDPFSYAKYLVLGKYQWETFSNIPLEQAFSGTRPNPIDTSPGTGPPVMPGRGEVGHQIEGSFNWSRQ